MRQPLVLEGERHELAIASKCDDAGIHYCAALLANSSNAEMMSSGVFDNELFRDIPLADNENLGAAGVSGR